MATVHVAVVPSGAPIGGAGEIGVPAVPPAVVNALSTLMGRRFRNMPPSQYSFEA